MLRFFLFIKGHKGAQRGRFYLCPFFVFCYFEDIFKGTDRTVPFAPRPLCAPKNKSRTRGKDTRLYCINERIYQKPGRPN